MNLLFSSNSNSVEAFNPVESPKISPKGDSMTDFPVKAREKLSDGNGDAAIHQGVKGSFFLDGPEAQVELSKEEIETNRLEEEEKQKAISKVIKEIKGGNPVVNFVSGVFYKIIRKENPYMHTEGCLENLTISELKKVTDILSDKNTSKKDKEFIKMLIDLDVQQSYGSFEYGSRLESYLEEIRLDDTNITIPASSLKHVERSLNEALVNRVQHVGTPRAEKSKPYSTIISEQAAHIHKHYAYGRYNYDDIYNALYNKYEIQYGIRS